MNDLEARLRSLTFREPPPGWRGAIVPARLTQPSSWRVWLAPHPAAWGALAAIWMVLGLAYFLVDGSSASSSTPFTAGETVREPFSEAPLFVYQRRSDAALLSIQ
jgi:hypothetical protein